MISIDFSILGIGAWGQGFCDWHDLTELLDGKLSEEESAKSPKPEVIPANERRRAPLPVKLAVETSWQATQMAQLDPKDLPCVFVSGLGDTQLTDYMCNVLTGENKALSPTKFHNSVHNAAAGYWTISTGCMQSANSVAGFEESVSLALMEALIQAQSLDVPILLTFYDAPSSELLLPLLKNQQSFAFSMVIAPGKQSDKGFNYKAEIGVQDVAWPSAVFGDGLQHAYEFNPVGRILSFARIIATNEQMSLSMPLSSDAALTITKSTG
jgi:hypothetical protein